MLLHEIHRRIQARRQDVEDRGSADEANGYGSTAQNGRHTRRPPLRFRTKNDLRNYMSRANAVLLFGGATSMCGIIMLLIGNFDEQKPEPFKAPLRLVGLCIFVTGLVCLGSGAFYYFAIWLKETRRGQHGGGSTAVVAKTTTSGGSEPSLHHDDSPTPKIEIKDKSSLDIVHLHEDEMSGEIDEGEYTHNSNVAVQRSKTLSAKGNISNDLTSIQPSTSIPVMQPPKIQVLNRGIQTDLTFPVEIDINYPFIKKFSQKSALKPSEDIGKYHSHPQQRVEGWRASSLEDLPPVHKSEHLRLRSMTRSPSVDGFGQAVRSRGFFQNVSPPHTVPDNSSAKKEE